MCSPSMPEMPKMPEPPPPMPAAPAPIEPTMPPPPPEVMKSEAQTIKAPESSRKAATKAAQGKSALTIPLNSGNTKSGLNIPT